MKKIILFLTLFFTGITQLNADGQVQKVPLGIYIDKISYSQDGNKLTQNIRVVFGPQKEEDGDTALILEYMSMQPKYSVNMAALGAMTEKVCDYWINTKGFPGIKYITLKVNAYGYKPYAEFTFDINYCLDIKKNPVKFYSSFRSYEKLKAFFDVKIY